MKIIHTSDIHLDSPLTSRLSALSGRERRRELTATFRKIIDGAGNMGASAIIISGDLFDSDRATIKTIDGILGIIEASPEISFFYLPGNHEKDCITASALKIPQNLFIFGEEWTYFEIGNVTVAGRSKISANMFSSLSLDEKRINIVALHGELSERSGENEKIGRRELEKLPIDYVALGHYHSYSENKISQRTTAVYSGTPEGRGFDEVGDKGYVLLQVTDKGVSHKFTKAAKRTLHIKEVDISCAAREIDIENLVLSEICNIPSEDLVRVVLVGEHGPSLVRDTVSLEKRFSERVFYLEVKDKSKIRICPEDYKNDKSLKGEFIRLVMAKDELTEEQKARVIECGIRALAGEL